jgi:hypothetical protein
MLTNSKLAFSLVCDKLFTCKHRDVLWANNHFIYRNPKEIGIIKIMKKEIKKKNNKH